jgi:hypothetical protein
MKRKITKNEILKLISCGISSCSLIADKLNCGQSVVYTFCKRNNIKLDKIKRGGLNVKDLTGQKIGELLIIKREGSIRKLATWLCLCPCGKNFIAVGSDIIHNKTKTCGCRINVKSRRNWQGYNLISKKTWSSIIKNAEQRGLEVNISIEYIDELFIQQDKKCKLSGLPIEIDSNASLDRIDSSIGYIKGNVQWVHKDVNMMKQAYDNEYFIKICKLIGNKHA